MVACVTIFPASLPYFLTFYSYHEIDENCGLGLDAIHVNVLLCFNIPKLSSKLIFCYNGCDIHSQELVQGFDQETAAVVMARLASFKMETEVHCIIFWPNLSA